MGELPKGVLILGSVPLKNAEEVLRTFGKVLVTPDATVIDPNALFPRGLRYSHQTLIFRCQGSLP